MVSLSRVQLKSCSSLQQRNQQAGSKANNISQAMTVPSFTGDHLSAQSSMGRAQVTMNKSKVAFKGGVLTIGMTEAEKAARRVRKAAEKAAKKAAEEEFYRTHESYMTYDGYMQWS